ncbi:membrane protein of unknown function [Candidatus Saccharimonas aalborgensis]|uniref:Probable membrane transporter protein n=1 Tax=Candidatus Saccharimonas aalborgensis TaxID=1332188 RepID=R4PK10_9BACT|nr:sulfite exporter TauE/SafE family protein [Candidatus Saccharimonas aalborgensis]AGL61838.1 membrane protein of unknown function [Candidatus Saccharimonas aalborgensis]
MDITLLLTFFVSFIASVLSGIAGGGVSFVTTPFWLVIGLTPAQGGATGAFMATGMSLGSLATFRKSGHIPKDRKLFYILAVVTLIASILGVFVVPKIDISVFRTVLAIITLAALPLLFVKPSTKYNLKKYKKLGLALAAGLMVIGSIIISGAFSILFTLVLVVFFGMSVLQTTAMKRLLFFLQSVVLLIGFAVQGYLLLQYAAVAFFGGILGAHIGTKYAVKKGENFAKYALAVMALVGAIALLV